MKKLNSKEKHNQRNRLWRAKNLEKARQIGRESYHRHKEARLISTKKWYTKNSDVLKVKRKKEVKKKRNYDLKRLYGIDTVQYNELLLSQNGVCAICGNSPGKRRLAVDHDHLTGSVRGLLCHFCNKSLGGFMDSVDLLASAIRYISVRISSIPRL